MYVYNTLPVRFRLQGSETNKPASYNDPDKTVVVIGYTTQPKSANQTSATAGANNKQPIFSHVDVMPQFPGGEAALIKWLSENLIYPKEAAEQGIQGTVILRFVMTPDGSVGDVEIIKGLDPACDKEAIRVIKTMPKWTPGKQNGNPVSVYYSLPVRFRLQGDAAKESTFIENKPNAIIEIDGKVVSKEELEKFDHTTIESIALYQNRIIVKTKKK